MATRSMAEAFNEWMRRYTDEPARFEAEFRTVGAFLQQMADGTEPTYGDECAAYLAEIMAGEERGPGMPAPAVEKAG